MKLLIILLFISCSAFGQSTYDSRELQDLKAKMAARDADTSKAMISMPVILLVSDTAHLSHQHEGTPLIYTYQSSDVHCIKGYEIGYYSWPSHPDIVVWNEQKVWFHVSYLDADRKPLKYFVWMSKPTNQ